MANYKQHIKRASNYLKRFSKYKAFKKAKKSPFSQNGLFGPFWKTGRKWQSQSSQTLTCMRQTNQAIKIKFWLWHSRCVRMVS